ncbi:MAG: succinylglutamate desuccinylase/aspartoacylase family protein [candidate division SR1 bacterium]|nr:succinylglutamate desuccinylase/aspartoacylase family protein [candidate division SR1 bacterium]
MIEKISFKGNKQGPNLLILGAIHGDEPCGTHAINKIIKEIQTNILQLESGSITCIPICNPNAYMKRVRYTEKNLNRVIKNHDKPLYYEEQLANILIEEIEKCDYLLDLHSMQSSGTSFVFQDYNDTDTISFCKNMELEYVITGRTKLAVTYENADTVGYAHKYGKIGAVVECGQHNDNKSKEVAYTTIINTLIGLGVIAHKKTNSQETISIVVTKVISKVKSGNFSQTRKHLDYVKTGMVLSTYDDGESIIAEENGYILLPNETAKIGDERFYIGK